MKVAAIISNFNTPERANALSDYLRERSHAHVLVVDNGSKTELPKNTAVRLLLNVRLTHSYLLGLAYADALAATSGEPYDAYWFLTTSLQFIDGDGDPAELLAQWLVGDVVYASPLYEGATRWPHFAMSKPGVTDHFGGAGMYRADWFDANGRFDSRLTYNWGTDYDTSLQAMKQGKKGVVVESVKMQLTENAGYLSGAHGITVDEYHERASREMNAVMSEKWPAEWPLLKDRTDYEAVRALHN